MAHDDVAAGLMLHQKPRGLQNSDYLAGFDRRDSLRHYRWTERLRSTR